MTAEILAGVAKAAIEKYLDENSSNVFGYSVYKRIDVAEDGKGAEVGVDYTSLLDDDISLAFSIVVEDVR